MSEIGIGASFKPSFSPLESKGASDLGQMAKPTSGASFLDTLKGALHEGNELQLSADKEKLNFASGKGGSLHEIVIAGEKAELAVRSVVALRNKIVEAYHEIMRMQI